MSYQPIKRKRPNDLPICQYGSNCYRKNPEHHEKFRHSNIDDEDPSIGGISKRKTKNSQQINRHILNPSKAPSVNKPNQTTKKKDVTLKKFFQKVSPISDEYEKEDSFDKEDLNESKGEENDDIDEDNCKMDKMSLEVAGMQFDFLEKTNEILKNMPKDFFDFWKFCSTLNKSKPHEAFAELGLNLIGVYDLLSRKIPADKVVNLHCHWRFYYDPPEFQTVIKCDGKELYHIGYFRDDPSELPLVLASNSAKNDCKFAIKGDNIFAAMNFEMTEALKKSKDKKLNSKFHTIHQKLKSFASQNKYSLEIQSAVVKRRGKNVVAKTFHGLGIVVPVINDIGYRPLPDSDAVIKNVLKKIVSAEDENKRLEEEENLDELITNVQFANDECDYGMGLELGLDLFCFGNEYFHSHILHLLPLAYNLLKRPKYAEIVKAHLQNRKLSDSLDTL